MPWAEWIKDKAIIVKECIVQLEILGVRGGQHQGLGRGGSWQGSLA